MINTNADAQFIANATKILNKAIEIEENSKLLRQQAETNHRLMQQMARLLKRVADEGDLIGEECRGFLGDFADSIPF